MQKEAYLAILLAVLFVLPVGMVKYPIGEMAVEELTEPAAQIVVDEGIQTIELQPDAGDGKDTFIHNTMLEDPDNNYGTSPELYVGSVNDREIRSLLQFDVPMTRMNLHSATLSMYSTQTFGTGEQNISVHPITNTWGEGFFDGSPDASNWTHRIGAYDTTLTTYDFEGNDGGFTPTLDWEWGTYSWTGGEPQCVPPPSAHSGTNMWGTVLNTNYNNLSANNTLTFTIDLTDPSILNGTLSWWDWYDVFEGWDHGEVYINGVMVLDREPSGTYNPPTGWTAQNVDLAPFVGGIATVVFAMWSTAVVSRAGWYIDDVEVSVTRPGPASPWITAGGDYNATVYSYNNVTQAMTWYSWNVTQIVQSWLGARPNLGFIMVPKNYMVGTNYLEFASSDSISAEFRPKLIITYHSEIDPPIPDQSFMEDDTTRTINLAYRGRGSVVHLSGPDNGWSIRPFAGGSSNEYHYQALYTYDQIGAEGVIQRISFYRSLMAVGTFNNVVISLGHTNLNEVTTTFADNYFGYLIEVFKAPNLVMNSSNDNPWFDFDLNGNFTYDSSHNLILDIQWSGDDGNTVNTAITSHGPDLRWVYATTLAAATGTTGIYTSRVTFVTDAVDCAVNDTGTVSNFWPFAPEDVPQMRCQMLYNYTEINGTGIIDKIRFQAFQPSPDWAVVENLSIRMAHSDNDTLDGNFNMHNSDPWREVFNRTSYNFSTNGNPEWIELDIVDTFDYNGNDNLLIEIRWIGGYGSDGSGVNLCRDNAAYNARCSEADYSAETGSPSSNHYNLQTIFLGSEHLTWSVTGSDNSLFSINVAGNNELRITPEQDAFGSGMATITLRNAEGEQMTQTINIDISPVNDAPEFTGMPPQINCVEDVDYIFNVSSHVSDVDDDIATMNYTTDSPYAFTNGSAEIVFNYPEGITREFVNITVRDPSGDSDTFMIEAVIEPVNDEPWFVGYLNTLTCHATVSTNLVLNPDDEETPGNCTIFTNSDYATVSGNTITFLYPKGLGSELVTIYLNDVSIYGTTNNVSYLLTVTIIDHPEVIANSPTGTDVPVTTTISVTFDTPMNASQTEQSFSLKAGSANVTGTFSWEGNTTIMTFTPFSHLTDQEYDVSVSTGAMDDSGLHMLQSYTWNFTAVYGNFDGDGDGMPDQYEIDNGLNPDSDDAALDLDNDGIPNLWEYENGLDPTVNDADGDADGDGASNLDEFKGGTDPNDPTDKPFTFPLLLILLILIIVIAAVLVAVMMLRRKSKKVDADDGYDQGPYEEPVEEAPGEFEQPVQKDPIVYEETPPPPPPESV